MTTTASTHNSTFPCGAGCAAATDLVDRWTLTGISPCCACTSGGRVWR